MPINAEIYLNFNITINVVGKIFFVFKLFIRNMCNRDKNFNDFDYICSMNSIKLKCNNSKCSDILQVVRCPFKYVFFLKLFNLTKY